jgi:hypothetical protein
VYIANIRFNKICFFTIGNETQEQKYKRADTTHLCVHFMQRHLTSAKPIVKKQIRYGQSNNHRRFAGFFPQLTALPDSCWLAVEWVGEVCASGARMWKSVKCALFAGFDCKYSRTLLSKHTHLSKDGANKILSCVVSYTVNLPVKVQNITYISKCFELR